MKALPPTAPRHEPCAPAEQSNAWFFIITPRLSHLMPLFPLSSLLRKPFCHLASKSLSGPKDQLQCLLLQSVFQPGVMSPSFELSKHFFLPLSLSLYFPLSPIKVCGWLDESWRNGGEGGRRKRRKPIQGIVGGGVEVTWANLENGSLPVYFMFWASLHKLLFIWVTLSVLPHFICAP